MSDPVLYAVRKPDGSIVQAAPSIDFEQALWEAACRDPQVKAFYNPESAYNVATARRKGYSFVAAVVVAADAEAHEAAVNAANLKARRGKR